MTEAHRCEQLAQGCYAAFALTPSRIWTHDLFSVGAYVANTNARGQLMLILGTMHNLEVYAIVIQKNDGAIF